MEEYLNAPYHLVSDLFELNRGLAHQMLYSVANAESPDELKTIASRFIDVYHTFLTSLAYAISTPTTTCPELTGARICCRELYMRLLIEDRYNVLIDFLHQCGIEKTDMPDVGANTLPQESKLEHRHPTLQALGPILYVTAFGYYLAHTILPCFEFWSETFEFSQRAYFEMFQAVELAPIFGLLHELQNFFDTRLLSREMGDEIFRIIHTVMTELFDVFCVP